METNRSDWSVSSYKGRVRRWHTKRMVIVDGLKTEGRDKNADQEITMERCQGKQTSGWQLRGKLRINKESWQNKSKEKKLNGPQVESRVFYPKNIPSFFQGGGDGGWRGSCWLVEGKGGAVGKRGRCRVVVGVGGNVPRLRVKRVVERQREKFF